MGFVRGIKGTVLIASLTCSSIALASDTGALSIDRVSLGLKGRNVLEMNYRILWKGERGPAAGLVNHRCLKIMSIVHELEDQDLIFHNTIFTDGFPTEEALDAPWATRRIHDNLDLAARMTALNRTRVNVYSQSSVDAWLSRGRALSREADTLRAPRDSCTETPRMTINSGAIRLRKDEVDPSNLGVSLPDEGNYWDVTEPLDLTTVCWLKTTVREEGSTSPVTDLFGEIDLRYKVTIKLEDASGYQYTVEFKTKGLTRFDEVKAVYEGRGVGSTQKQEVIGFSGLEIE